MKANGFVEVTAGGESFAVAGIADEQINVSKVVVDLNLVSPADVRQLMKAMATNSFKAAAVPLAKMIGEDPEAVRSMKYVDFMTLWRLFLDADRTALADGSRMNAVIGLRNISAAEMDDLFALMRAQDYEGLAKALPAIVVSLDHGDPNDPETYRKLSYLDFMSVMSAVQAEVKKTGRS